MVNRGVHVRLFAIAALVISVLIATAVGLRLLLLAWRTRQLPELSLGLGLTMVGLLGLMLSVLGRLPFWIGTPLGDGLFALGVSFSHMGIGLLFVFTWSVFRRHSTVAAAGLAAAWIACACVAAGLITQGTGGDDMQVIFQRTRPWAMAAVALVASCFAWSGIESARYYRMQRRRLALGLADPVVVNRFALWALVGGSMATLCGVLFASSLAGIPPLVSPLPQALCATMSSTSACAWYLSFLPPDRYLGWIRRRSPAFA